MTKKKSKGKGGAKKKPADQVKQRVVVFIEAGRIKAKGGYKKYQAFLCGAEDEIRDLDLKIEDMVEQSIREIRLCTHVRSNACVKVALKVKEMPLASETVTFLQRYTLGELSQGIWYWKDVPLYPSS